jgi:hypothetical protein
MRQHLENVEQIVMRALRGYQRTASMIPRSLPDSERPARRRPSRRRRAVAPPGRGQ